MVHKRKERGEAGWRVLGGGGFSGSEEKKKGVGGGEVEDAQWWAALVAQNMRGRRGLGGGGNSGLEEERKEGKTGGWCMVVVGDVRDRPCGFFVIGRC